MSGVESFSVDKAWNQPPPRKGPQWVYKNERDSNPVLRGYPLVVLGTLVASLNWLSGFLWRLNKFEKLKTLKVLDDYDPRHDPTVIPKGTPDEPIISIKELSHPGPRKKSTEYYTCADYHELYKSGRVTPLDVANFILPLVNRDTKPPGPYSIAFLRVREDLILAAAKASTGRYKAGKPLSVLDGVPLTVKDEVHLTGYKRTLGSPVDFTDAEDRTAWCVEKWQEAGAIIIGKTNMHEVGLDTNNNNPNTGTPLNPHNQGYYTGGSSGGSALVAAQGLCPIALGVDGGGSIRLPSSFCGIYGLKPTHGRVSARVGHGFWDSVACNGPMAPNIDDLALGYRIMAQPDPGWRGSALFPNSLLQSSIASRSRQGKKYIGLCQYWINNADTPVRELFNRAINHYVNVLGYEPVDIDIPCLIEGQKAHAMTILSESWSRFTSEQRAKFTYPTQIVLHVAGSHATAQDFLFAQRIRSMLMSHLAWLWETYPGMLVLTPTTPCAGWKIAMPSDITSGYGASDGDMSIRSMEYVWLANFTGAPAISCPMGYAEGDVPVGLMAMGEWGTEEALIAFAKEGEGILGNEGVRRSKLEGQWVDVIAGARSG